MPYVLQPSWLIHTHKNSKPLLIL